jgi:hypothetical protein
VGERGQSRRGASGTVIPLTIQKFGGVGRASGRRWAVGGGGKSGTTSIGKD